MNPQSILAITDFSVTTDAVLSRAAQLAAAHGAALELMYAPPLGDRSCPDAACRLAQHASQLGQHYKIRVHPVTQAANCFESIAHAARKVDLVVLGATRGYSLLSFFQGHPEARLLRAARRPVLVVCQEAGAGQPAYRRLLVAVDFSDASRQLVATALAIGISAQVELFHAISAGNERKLRYAEVSEQGIQAYLQQCRRYAQDRMFWLTDSTDARRNRVDSAIGHGDPARQAIVQQQHSGADLVVVGKSPASAVSDFVFGSVAQRVLRHASTDVLVIPHGFEFGTRALAVGRLLQDPPLTRRTA